MSTSIHPLRKAFTTNSTSTSFTAKTPTTTEPATSSTTGKYDLLDASLGFHQGNIASKFIQLIPYAVASNNDTFDMRVWGWSKTASSDFTTAVYIPQLLIELNVTIGNISGTSIAASTLMADTIVIAKGDSTSPVISPANDVAASILVHLRGCRYIEFDFDNTGSGTSFNALWRLMDQ